MKRQRRNSGDGNNDGGSSDEEEEEDEDVKLFGDGNAAPTANKDADVVKIEQKNDDEVKHESQNQELKEEAKEPPVEEDQESSSSIEDEPEPRQPDDMVNAIFKKVNRTKTKFRCHFEDVMIHIAGKDLVAKSIIADINY